MEMKSPRPKVPIGRALTIPRLPKQSLAFRCQSVDCVDGQQPKLASPSCSMAFDDQQSMHSQPREKTFDQETPINFPTYDTCSAASVVSSKTDIALNRDHKFMIRLGCNGEHVDMVSSSESLGNELSGLISRYLANSGRQVTFDDNVGSSYIGQKIGSSSSIEHNVGNSSNIEYNIGSSRNIGQNFGNIGNNIGQTVGNNNIGNSSNNIGNSSNNIGNSRNIDSNIGNNIDPNIVKNNNNDVSAINLNAEFQKSLKSESETCRQTYTSTDLRRLARAGRPTPDIESMIDGIFHLYPELKRSI